MNMGTCTKRHDILKRRLTVALETLGLRSSLRVSIIQALRQLLAYSIEKPAECSTKTVARQHMRHLRVPKCQRQRLFRNKLEPQQSARRPQSPEQVELKGRTYRADAALRAVDAGLV